MKDSAARRCIAILFVGGLATVAESSVAQPVTNPPARVIEASGSVLFQRAGQPDWYAVTNAVLVEGDRLRTLDDGRAVVELRDRTQLRMNPRSELVILPPRSASAKARVELLRGLLYFLHRNRPGELEVDTPVGTAAIEGTEFVLSVEETTGATLLSLIDGRVQLANEAGKVSLVSGDQGIMERGQPPRRTAVIEVRDVVQWWLYYPAVLDPDELQMDGEARAALADSLAAYRAGDLLMAFAAYPPDHIASTATERIYLASLRLSSGHATHDEELVGETDSTHPAAVALRFMMAAVRLETLTNVITATNASQWLGFSYYRQSQGDLTGALAAARRAVTLSTNFAFAWERVAELEFSFGRVPAAERGLSRALQLAPRNAQALALQGFLQLARLRGRDAEASFDRAIAIDPMLGNAWLGRGLHRIRDGRVTEGRQDLQTAALLEPNRSLLRSYLGKAFAHESLFAGNPDQRQELRALAEAELELAKRGDPLDPTSWLYSALLRHDEYRTAEAIRDLETSSRLNDSRQVYRSRLLLDQDQAVRSANLANAFEEAGMIDVSVRESARAVSYDYANYSAHLNLASSFNALRDPTRFNLRFESEWFNEHLLASLLAPVGAASLSQNLSQQEYSRLFAADRFGLAGTTEYISDGEWRQLASHFGTFGRTSYALDLDYNVKSGTRPNNDLSRIEWYSRIKHQVTPQDSALVLTKYQAYDAGDNFQYHSQTNARAFFRFEESQAPLLLAGWHHEWSPGVHTLFLGGRLINDQDLSDRQAPQLIAVVNPVATIDPTNVIPFDVTYHSEFETYSAEINQIVQRERHTDIFGARYQDGHFDADALLDNPPTGVAPLLALPEVSSTDARFRRLSLYAYHHWEIADGLLLIGGIAYDELTYPGNYRRPPLTDGEAKKQHWSPKAGLIWQAMPALTLRGVFSRASGGVSYDESVRLEPTQIAGFGQSFRSIISESLIGSVEAPDYQVLGGAVDLKPATNTWLSFQVQALHGEVRRDFGVFFYDFSGTPPIASGSAFEKFDYDELQTRAVFNQIIGREWFLDATYQFSQSELERDLPGIPATASYAREITTRADLHEIRLGLAWRSASGFFARGELWWFAQKLGGSAPQPDGDEFPQLNFYLGYRFPNRRAELTLGVLNATDDDYHLSPLNYYRELPRERLFYARFRFNF